MRRRVKVIRQLGIKDCGPTCLLMILNYFEINCTIDKVKEKCQVLDEAITIRSLKDSAESFGLKCKVIECKVDDLQNIPLPAILFVNLEHFLVLESVNLKLPFTSSCNVVDPVFGRVGLTKDEIISKFEVYGENKTGVALLFEKTSHVERFKARNTRDAEPIKKVLFEIVKSNKINLFWILFLTLVVSFLGTLIPLASQIMIDQGLVLKSKSIVLAILVAQVFVFLGTTLFDILKSCFLTIVGFNLNFSLTSSFLKKLMKLPIYFFENSLITDVTQRIGDLKRVERLLTSSTLGFLFSAFNIVFLSFVLYRYSARVFLIFYIGTFISLIWFSIFLGKRKKLDYLSFDYAKNSEGNILEIIGGMQEIKLFTAQDPKYSIWRNHQMNVYKLRQRQFFLEQAQSIGTVVINQLKNLFIIYFVVLKVMSSELSTGILLSVSIIIGQLSSPFIQLFELVKSTQDSRFSLSRVSEIFNRTNEDEDFGISEENAITVSEIETIQIKNLQFTYDNQQSMTPALKNVSLKIEKGQKVAFVGESGSGKSTLVKLLLKYYSNYTGEILINDLNLRYFKSNLWRGMCGVVSQNSYLFSDTIVGNISMLERNEVDREKITLSVTNARVEDFVNPLPQGVYTKIGQSGKKLSGGQEQRLYIARALYSDSDLLIFDEATSSLDSINEARIMENLYKNYPNKTMIIVAHRLSTIYKADKIFVFKKGEIVEEGRHEDLLKRNGHYSLLISNQIGISA